MVEAAVPVAEKASTSFDFLKSALLSPSVTYKLTVEIAFGSGSGVGGGFSATLFLLQPLVSISHTRPNPRLKHIFGTSQLLVNKSASKIKC
jgi:hypothetical protein